MVLRTPVRMPVAPRAAWKHVKRSSTSVQFWKFVVADAGAALFGVPLAFGLAYVFTDQIKAIVADVRRTERWLGLAGILAIAAIPLVGVYRRRRRLVTECPDEERPQERSPSP
jgi:hypothetical protein